MTKKPEITLAFFGVVIAIIGLLFGDNLVTRIKEHSTKEKKFSCPESEVVVNEILVNVPADEYWYGTDIEVQKGDCIEFSAKGSWYSGISTTDPDGDNGLFGIGHPGCGECPRTDGNLGELIGRIDDNPPFRIGSSIAQLIDQDGIIMLAMNENTGSCNDGPPGSCYIDNHGALDVKVTVRRIK